jgi:uncharacterized membrane protein/protein-disulfide isomerase
MPFNKNHSDASGITLELIKQLDLPVTTQTIIDELEIHPDYPSLLSISDVLGQFGITNCAFNNIAMNQLSDIPLPFIAHTNRNSQGNELLLIKNIDEKGIHTPDDILSPDNFNDIFKGVILAVEPLEDAGDHNYAKNKRLQLLNSLRTPTATISILLVIIMITTFHSSYFRDITLQNAVITLIKGTGLFTSILLLIQSIDANNPLIQRLCQNDTNKNCNAILSSNAAIATDGLSWSEVGFFYFSTTFLTFLFNSNNTAVMQALAILNLISLPYTFYSIYYQARVAKQWCVLCCTVQAVLWLDFFLLLPGLSHQIIRLSLKDLSNILSCFLVPFALWIWIKPYLQSAQKITPLTQQLNKFKYNIELFNKLLKEQAKYSIPGDDYTVVLGNLETPETIITIVTNPYCGPCTHAHQVLDELLYSKGSIQVRYVFVFNNPYADDDKRMVVTRQLLALDKVADKATVSKAMSEWYKQKQKDFDTWAKKYPAPFDESITNKLEKQVNWRNIAEIRATPTILINGYKLPYPYTIADLKYF